VAFERIEKISMGLTTFGSGSSENMPNFALCFALFMLLLCFASLGSIPLLHAYPVHSRSFAYVLEVIEVALQNCLFLHSCSLLSVSANAETS
jgi:hypothetical protein